jgi:hypothetical protein
VRRLATEAGVDAQDAAAVRRFDKQRAGRKTSNQEWVNPYDPDAKVSKAKDGSTDMLYKPENIVDLDTGAILNAEVRKADEADTEGLALRTIGAVELVEAIREEASAGKEPVPAATETLTGDKGYYCVEELEAIQQGGIATIISDPLSHRRVDKLDCSGQAAVSNALLSVKSMEGRELLRRRGMHIERGFAHILDSGGMRRATLRGQVNLDKRYKIAAATYNLSQLMRNLFGIGTSKQAAASVLCGLLELILASLEELSAFFALLVLVPVIQSPFLSQSVSFSRPAPSNHRPQRSGVISTGCYRGSTVVRCQN